jgi:hypothetical protein
MSEVTELYGKWLYADRDGSKVGWCLYDIREMTEMTAMVKMADVV